MGRLITYKAHTMTTMITEHYFWKQIKKDWTPRKHIYRYDLSEYNRIFNSYAAGTQVRRYNDKWEKRTQPNRAKELIQGRYVR